MSRLRNTLKRISTPFLQGLYKWYASKDRTFQYKEMHLEVKQGVFHPGLFISTKILLDFLSEQSLEDQQLLELGCGSGAVSVWAAKNGALVNASDINPQAILNVQQNADLNKVVLQTYQSDLFQEIPPQIFHWIIINPPYYPKAPQNDAEKAFFCGPEFEYFHALFTQMKNYVSDDSRVVMILSEDCQLETIEQIAQQYEWKMEVFLEKKVMGEMNYLFELKH